jgi:uncharacterized protein YcbK (DUF882 family)
MPDLWGYRILQARRWGLVAAAFACAAGCALGISARAAQERTITLYNIHTKETLTSTYKRDGKFIPAEMEKINWILRDWRRDEATQMDPQLIDLIWEMHSELGSAEPVHIISGYRSRNTNNMLRQTVGGQASESRHILGKAADVHFPDVPVKKLRYSALVREKGGVGYYPTSALPFVHVDIDRVRAWPRLPRAELALLFPSGRTQHVPADGEPITADDVREARAGNKELAAQLAEFHDLRSRPKAPPMQVASLTPTLPQLLGPPRVAERPMGLGTRASDTERSRLAHLSAEPLSLASTFAPIDGALPGAAVGAGPDRAAAGRLTWSASLSREPTSFAPAPAFDEEHPDELSYRPFPIAPLLTATSSADDPVLARMVHPDLGKVLESFEHGGSLPPMRLRPGLHEAQAMWTQQLRGEATGLTGPRIPAAAPGPLANRKVQTTQAR